METSFDSNTILISLDKNSDNCELITIHIVAAYDDLSFDLDHLNPIELAFNIYKAYLKRNMDRYESNWFQTHLHALAEVNRDVCINEYKRCKMPKCDNLLSSPDEQEIVAMLLSQELIYNKH